MCVRGKIEITEACDSHREQSLFAQDRRCGEPCGCDTNQIEGFFSIVVRRREDQKLGGDAHVGDLYVVYTIDEPVLGARMLVASGTILLFSRKYFIPFNNQLELFDVQ